MKFGLKKASVTYHKRVAVYGIVIKNKKVLLFTKGDKHFLPGGGQEGMESLEECLIREFTEEVGQECIIKEYIGEATLYDFVPPHEKYYEMIGYFYNTEIQNAKVEIIDKEYRPVWINIDEAIAKNMLFLAHQAWALERVYCHNLKKA